MSLSFWYHYHMLNICRFFELFHVLYILYIEKLSFIGWYYSFYVNLLQSSGSFFMLCIHNNLEIFMFHLHCTFKNFLLCYFLTNSGLFTCSLNATCSKFSCILQFVFCDYYSLDNSFMLISCKCFDFFMWRSSLITYLMPQLDLCATHFCWIAIMFYIHLEIIAMHSKFSLISSDLLMPMFIWYKCLEISPSHVLVCAHVVSSIVENIPMKVTAMYLSFLYIFLGLLISLLLRVTCSEISPICRYCFIIKGVLMVYIHTHALQTAIVSVFWH